MDTMHPIIERSLKEWMPEPWLGLKRPLPALPSANIRFRGIDWQVAYEYQSAERETALNPGSDSSVEITEIYLMNGRDDLSDLLGESVKAEMEAKLLRQLGEES